MKRLLTILGFLLVSSVYAGELTNKVWVDNLVIDWGEGAGKPKVALLHGDKVTKDSLNKATVLDGVPFEWRGEPVPGVWVFYLPDEMIGEYFTVALLTPVKMAGVGSMVFRTKEAIMMTKVKRALGWKWKRSKQLNANGVVGNRYTISPDEVKCFGPDEDCAALKKRMDE